MANDDATRTTQGALLRFDDRLATVLAQPRDDAAACAIVWRQLVDLLAQIPAEGMAPPANALIVLRRLHDRMPQPGRAAAAAALAGRRVHPAVVALFAGDRSAVAAAMIGRVRLDDATWLALLPGLPVTARALLRQRRDLSPIVRMALACFGTSDFALPPGGEPPPTGSKTSHQPGDPASPIGQPTPPPPADSAPERQTSMGLGASPLSDMDDEPPVIRLTVGDLRIRELLDRRAGGDEAPPAPPALPPVDAFRFETGPDGVILWVEGAPRAALIGATIARAAKLLGQGVDGQAAGAFRHRASFRDARLVVAGGSAVAGEWRIAGVPVFDPRDGRFTGYRGTARRPRVDQQAVPVADGLYGTGLPADSLRQLVHELRTPLNAIVGFGEMIERQVLGPAALRYRLRAGVIVEQGRRLLGVVDDLDMAARAGTSQPETPPDPIAPADLLRALWRTHRPVAAERGVTLEMAIGAGIDPVDADPAAIERMYARLLAAALGLGRPGERIVARLNCVGGAVVLRLTRPTVLGDSSETMLLDPGFTPEGDWPEAPLLGLGFSLRLVRNLAIAAGGGLDIEAEGFTLRLPVAAGRKANEATPR